MLVCALGAATAILALAGPASSQSLTTGTLHGSIRDSVGVSLSGVRLTLTDVGTGVSHVIDASWSGRFELAFLPPGTYDLLAERLGYRPRRVEGIPVRAGRRIGLDVTLAEATPPIGEVDVERFGAAAAADAGADFSAFEFDALPTPDHQLGDLAILSSISAADLSAEGLPASLTDIVVDGLSLETARHPAFLGDPFRTASVPLGAVGLAALRPGAVDVEWPGGAGGRLVAYTRQGGRDFSVRGYGNWSGDALSVSDFFEAAPHSSLQGGFVASGPLIRDTAHFVVGVEGRRLETPLPRAWELASAAEAGRAVARDSFGVELASLEQPRLMRTEVVSAFTRLDWRVANGHALTVRANVATVPSIGMEPTAFGLRGAGGIADIRDVYAAASLTSRLGSRLSQELRVGFGQSKREFDVADDAAPFTGLVDGGLGLGLDPALPARLERTSIEATQSLHFSSGAHRLKAGISFDYSRYEDAYAYGRNGWYLFGAANDFARGEGFGFGSLGPGSAVPYSVPRAAAFVQDTWSAMPGLDLTVGMRYELEKLPIDDLRPDVEWYRLTGLANVAADRTLTRLSPRVGVTWDVGQQHRWLIDASAGVFHDRVDPAVLSELFLSDGRAAVYRALGEIGGWPEAPLAAATADTGNVLTLLGPEFAAPRTTRASIGVSRIFGIGTTVSVNAALRRTDFLPRRVDLNLRAAAMAEDQYGRPLYGTLGQYGGLLGAVPGSNRRFDAYDRVYAINADGRSDYWGVTVALEHRTDGPFTFFGRYTFSETRDNWLSGRGGGPDDGLSPFPAGLDGEDWSEGRSDFDVPHRAVAGAELKLPVLAGLRIAGIYRFRSGDPFTPGFRYGVDANGDGAFGNDPAFVEHAIEGIPELIDDWDCLWDHVDGFVERNACRMPGVHSVDMRLGIGLPHFLGVDAELVVDGFNLVESDVGIPDRALYLIDETRALEVDAATGRVTVPLVANPHFGKLLQRWGSGRSIRIGLRVGY